MKNEANIKKLEKILTSPHVSQGIKDKAQAEIDKLRAQNKKKPEAKGHVYKLGDKYRSDFDDKGLLLMSLNAGTQWGVAKLKQLHSSYEDNNYHTTGSPLWKAATLLDSGKKEEAEKEIEKFHDGVREDLKEQGYTIPKKENKSTKSTERSIFLKEVVIEWQEGSNTVTDKTYNNLEDVVAQMKKAGIPKKGNGYNKNKLTFKWEDGHSVTTRVDVGNGNDDYYPTTPESLASFVYEYSDLSGDDQKKYAVAFKSKSKSNGIKSLLKDEPKKTEVPDCDELLANLKKRKEQAKKSRAKAPKDAGDVLTRAVKRSANRIKKNDGLASQGEKTKISKAITSLLDTIKNDKDLIKELISKLKKLL